MNTDFRYIIGGFAILALIGALLTSAYTYLFLKIFKQKIPKKIYLGLAVMTVSWLLATLVSVMFLSNFGVIPFSVVLTLLLLGLGFLLSKKSLGLSLRYAIFYSIGFSVIINPVWYFLF